MAVAVEQRENVIAALTTDAQPQTEGATQASTEKAELRTASIVCSPFFNCSHFFY